MRRYAVDQWIGGSEVWGHQDHPVKLRVEGVKHPEVGDMRLSFIMYVRLPTGGKPVAGVLLREGAHVTIEHTALPAFKDLLRPSVAMAEAPTALVIRGVRDGETIDWHLVGIDLITLLRSGADYLAEGLWKALQEFEQRIMALDDGESITETWAFRNHFMYWRFVWAVTYALFEDGRQFSVPARHVLESHDLRWQQEETRLAGRTSRGAKARLAAAATHRAEIASELTQMRD